MYILTNRALTSFPSVIVSKTLRMSVLESGAEDEGSPENKSNNINDILE